MCASNSAASPVNCGDVFELAFALEPSGTCFFSCLCLGILASSETLYVGFHSYTRVLAHRYSRTGATKM